MNDKINVRMCVCCRTKLSKENLKRVYFDNGLKHDKTLKMGFRGAYICSKECFLKAYKTGRLKKALRCTDISQNIEELESALFNEQ